MITAQHAPDVASTCTGKPSASRWWTIAVSLLVLSIALGKITRTVDDPDLWGHVRFGQDLWHTRDLYRADIYSYLSGEQPWINHEWLAELALYATYAAGGATGLIVLKTLVGLAMVTRILRQLLRGGLSPALSGLLTMLALTLSLPGLCTVRPHLFTYFCLLVLLLLLTEAERGNPRWLWAAVPLFALWPNLHGGFMAGAGVLLLWCAATATETLLRRRLHLARQLALNVALPSALAMLATLLNPYGWRLWQFLLRTATVPRPEISEWQPLPLLSLWGALYLALLALGWLGLARSRLRRSLALLAVCGVLSVAPLVAQRHAVLFALSVPVLAGVHIGDAYHRWWAPRSTSRANKSSRRAGPWVAIACCAGAVALLPSSWSNLGCVRMDVPSIYPIGAVELLRREGVAGNMVVDFEWGEYVLWHLGPRVKVSVDGRRETVYAEAVYQENLNLMYGVGTWDALLERPETDMALVSKARAAWSLMRLKPGWALVYEDDVSGLFARDPSPLLDQLRAARPPEPPPSDGVLCFP